MAPTQQSSAVAESNSEMTAKTTSSSTNMVHNINKESYNSSSSNHCHNDSQNSINSRLFGRPQEMLLPITSKGHFFNDAFFEDARKHFEGNMKNVLDQWDQESSVQDDLTSYGMLRKADLSENSQAATVIENNTCHQVVMDVRDFKAGDVKVKVVDEDEVVVEGSVEQQNGGSESKQSFRRSFTFPGLVKDADITSTMSVDGILTITVPKKESIAQCTNITIQQSNKKSNTAEETTKTSVESPRETSTRTQSGEASSVASSRRTSTNSLTKDSMKVHQTSDEKNSTTETTCKKPVSENGFPVQPSGLLLPISHSGLFFQDSFFTQTHQEFEEAMKKVLNAVGESPKDDVMSSYRSLRERNLADENQAVSVTEDSKEHKVVMDVRDFMASDVKVRVIDEDEVVVEGNAEQQNKGSMSKKSFRRSFTFPGLVKAADITSTMSSDGILTITVPKKESIAQCTNITIQQSNKKSNTAEETTKTSVESPRETSTRTQSGEASSVASSRRTSTNSLTKDSMKVHQTSDEKNSTTETTCKKPVSENGFPVQPSGLLLPIFHSGLFFQDSFFTQTHQEFEEAMKKVLNAVGESPKDDIMSSYRSLRERNLADENQAVSVTEDSEEHKVVMDVRDFMAGGVEVKVVDENKVVVEGSEEQQNEGSMSKQRFRRSFTFPGLVKVEATLSADGILTIKVPKKERSDDVRVSGNNSKATESVTTSNTESSSSNNSSSNSVEESSSNTSVHNEAAVGTNKQVSSMMSDDKQEVGNVHSLDLKKTSHSHLNATSESSWVLDSLLPVFPKGSFFHDSFFKDSQQHFDAAVKEVLSRFNHDDSPTDNLSLYRNLRTNDMTNKSLAVKVTENEQVHQVVLDVRDFLEGDIKVKVVGKNEVQVEGKVEKQEGSCTSTRSFRQWFQLPGVVDVKAVTSALSSDGVLTIKAVKGGVASSKRDC